MAIPPFKNRLGETASPYLLQHRDNPVHWFAWGEEALATARQLDRPILLSIGYAACHWCHVMAHESFEDPDIAALMNELFINVKVDREERPDIDHLYMSALHALGEQGGWPLTMFLAPDGTPFWGGTYFPPSGRYGRPGFPDVLRGVDQAWRERRFAVESTGRRLVEALQATTEHNGARLDRATLELASQRLLTVMDSENGGTRGAPKFPNASLLELFERAYERSGDEAFAAIVDLTLEKLCLGGIYDHIGGGLCRYSTDEDWLVPHFEKMLYDNAQLINQLASAFARTGNRLFLRRIEETIAWMLRDLKADRPAFAASLDADSDGGEGTFYVWTPAEIEAVLGPDAAAFCSLYDITAAGNWENVSIPNLLRHPRNGVAAESLPSVQLARLNVSRETRKRPATDDKILADWNALTVSALIRASLLCERPEWLALAGQLYRFIADSMLLTPAPCHSVRLLRAGAPAMASDYASFAEAALVLYQAAPEPRLLADCATALDILHTHYRHQATGLYTLATSTASDMPLHLPATTDEATPNLHASALTAMISLAHYAGEAVWLERADDLFARLAAPALANPYGHAALLNAFDLRLCAVAIVLVIAENDARKPDFVQQLRRLVPRKLFLTILSEGEDLPVTHPAHGKTINTSGEPAIYVCVGERCSLPVAAPDEVLPLIRAMLAGP